MPTALITMPEIEKLSDVLSRLYLRMVVFKSAFEQPEDAEWEQKRKEYLSPKGREEYIGLLEQTREVRKLLERLREECS